VTIKEIDQLENLKSSSKMKEELLVVKFGASWCAPCKAIQGFYEKLSASPGGTFGIVDVDEADDIMKKIATSLPTFVIFNQGEEVHRVVGANENALFDALKTAGLFGGAKDAQQKAQFDFTVEDSCKT
jgi:thioredoxin 1